jgi:hypothetical protein
VAGSIDRPPFGTSRSGQMFLLPTPTTIGEMHGSFIKIYQYNCEWCRIPLWKYYVVLKNHNIDEVPLCVGYNLHLQPENGTRYIAPDPRIDPACRDADQWDKDIPGESGRSLEEV